MLWIWKYKIEVVYMASYYEDLILNYQIENPINKVISKITNLIKYENDYESAIKIISENNLKLEDIASCTIRLKRKQIVNLASKLISIKK